MADASPSTLPLLHPGGGTSTIGAAESGDVHLTVKATKAGRKKGSRNKQSTYTIMQWNQKELTLLCTVDEARAACRSENKKKQRAPLENAKHEQSLKRVENLVRTLKDSGGVQGPAACVIEEVRAGGGGRRAVEFIAGELNQHFEKACGHSPEAWRWKLSGEVNPMSGKKEMYAIIWNSDLLGDLVEDAGNDGHRLMTGGFEKNQNEGRRPKRAGGNVAAGVGGGSRADQKEAEEKKGDDEKGEEGKEDPHDDRYDFEIGDAKIDLSRGRSIWAEMKRCELGWHANEAFDRVPTLFSFRPDALKESLHIVAIHGATGAHFKSPHQQIAETMFLQEICGQAAEQGEYVVLVGDFNTAEENNRTERLWMEDQPLHAPDNDASAGGDFDEAALLQATKTRFLAHFYRGVPSSLPTNVYPFLAGGNATPKHNNDIWLPRDESLKRRESQSRMGRRKMTKEGKHRRRI
jgi:hypothetical protein